MRLTRATPLRRRARAHVEALACETIPLRVMPWRGRARRVLVLRFLRLSLIIAGGLLAARLVAAVVGTRRVDGVILAKATPLNAIVSAIPAPRTA